ncbi:MULTISPECIES: threonine/serine ThrE exporter family protein [Mumia]|uniref:Threonine/serine exporter ThrE family protein n=1 Tax=Mumia xiangluensis TaxID=1678900 RepID=A0ABW1QSI1_9ACTN|nr:MULTISPECIES: threonine/serine exporter family protein [Mumia]
MADVDQGDPHARPARLPHRLSGARQRVWAGISRIASSRLPSPAPPPEPLVEQPPEAVLDFLRLLGVAMCRAGDAADRVTLILDDVARAYSAKGVSFFVLPTGVFVRIVAGSSTRVDFAPGSNRPLRLDQIDDLYRLIDDIRHSKIEVGAAAERLTALTRSRPRFGPVVRVLGTGVLTVGLGLVLNPTASTLPVYFALGVMVGLLELLANRVLVLSLVLPVVAAFGVTWAAFELAGPYLDAWPLDIVIPSLITMLPGAALTMATVELAAGSMISGSARLIYGLERLLLLTVGIAMGIEAAGLPVRSGDAPTTSLGAWAPWVGVLVFGLGHFFASSAPRRTLVWLLVVLYVAYGAQAASGVLLGALGASFVAGAVVLPVAYAVQSRRSGPPVPVTFLPAFWLLVPGALSLQGVAELVGADAAAGLGDFINALLSIVAIAVGVLVGAGLSERVGRATSTWRGL